VTVGALLPIYRNAEIGGSWEKRTWLDDTRERSFLTPAVIVWKRRDREPSGTVYLAQHD
jgi:hypothetical protein